MIRRKDGILRNKLTFGRIASNPTAAASVKAGIAGNMNRNS